MQCKHFCVLSLFEVKSLKVNSMSRKLHVCLPCCIIWAKKLCFLACQVALILAGFQCSYKSSVTSFDRASVKKFFGFITCFLELEQ